MGLETFGDLRHKMNNVLGVVIPNGVNGDQVRKLMLEDFGIEIGTSFGPLHGKVWRIGTMGYNARKDCVMQTLSALEAVLNYLRFTTTQGAANAGGLGSLPHRGHPMSDTVRQQAEREAAASRVMARADQLAALSETADALTRVYLSPEHLQANQLVGQWMQAAGMMVWQDSVGNICGRYEGQQEGAPAVLLGSHLDTVRNAGRYDGMLGVLAAIEVVQRLHQQGRRLAKAIEIVGFGDEEGTRFGITLLGSRGVTGTWPESWLSQCDADGVSVAQALVNAGLDPARIAHAARHPRDIAAYLELHIEQGPCLEQAGLALGVVEAINGARRLNCRFTGEAGHAGTVPMLHRKDALAAAAEWMVQVENLTRQRGGNLVATVGTLRCAPGAVNVIPGEVQLTLDIRGRRMRR
ncbi:N-carbamoyl-L-amino acid hydrolase [Klebsiella pneumoniae]|nr:N-carbamoyl-L-amino acid hydrolase [Klebsiella pneumoniae]